LPFDVENRKEPLDNFIIGFFLYFGEKGTGVIGISLSNMSLVAVTRSFRTPLGGMAIGVPKD